MLLKPKKTLGVLGGMGPAAAAEFLRILAHDAGAKNDAEHPRIFMISDPETPDRSDAIQGIGPSPADVIKRNLLQLAGWGADVLAVPCNTAHFFIDSFRQELPVPLVHIVEATVRAARRLSPGGAWLLATSGTKKCRIYPNCAEKLGYHFLEPSDSQQERLQSSLRAVKAGQMEQAGKIMKGVVEELWSENEAAVATACTELPLAYAASGLPAERQISSIQALSDACLNVLFKAQG